MRGGGAAATAHDGRAGCNERLDVGGEFLRPDRKHGLAVHDLRHAGVGLHRNGTRDDAREAFHVRAHLVRPEPAVETKRIHAQPFEERRHALHVAAGEELAILAERDGGDDGQVAVLLRGEHGGLEFVRVAHRLDHHEVGARRYANANLFCEGLVGGVELEIAGGLQEASGGADVEGDERRNRFRDGNACCDDVRKRRVAMVLRGVRAEGVGVDHIRARRAVGGVDGADVIGARQVPQLGDLAGGESPGLKLRPHASVEEQRTPDWKFKRHIARRRPFSPSAPSRCRSRSASARR